MAMTDKERQKRRREKLKAEGKVYLSLYLDAEAHRILMLEQKVTKKSYSDIISSLILDELRTHSRLPESEPPGKPPAPLEVTPSHVVQDREAPPAEDPAARREVHQKIVRLRDSGLNWNEIADLLEAWGIEASTSGQRFETDTLIRIYRREKSQGR